MNQFDIHELMDGVERTGYGNIFLETLDSESMCYYIIFDFFENGIFHVRDKIYLTDIKKEGKYKVLSYKSDNSDNILITLSYKDKLYKCYITLFPGIKDDLAATLVAHVREYFENIV